MKTILVPLDGSALADRAVPFAATIAARAGWSLLLLRAVNTLSAPTDAAGLTLKREAQEALDGVASSLATDSVIAVTRVVEGQPETAILDATADEDVCLVVMSTHGRGGLGRWIYGSVADTVLRHAPVPVLTVPPHGLSEWSPEAPVKIMVALDGSALARAALEPAGELADILGGSLLLTSIVTFPQYAAYADGYTFVDADQTNNVVAETRHELEELAAGLRTETRLVEVAVTYGSPYFGITALARDLGAGLLVMATHGRSGMSRAVLGSVATATIRRTEVPILLVRPVETQQVVEALPAIEAPPVAALVEAEPTIAIALSATELEMLTKVVGERFHNEPVDPRSAEPVRRLLEKLRAARAVPPAQAPASPLAPVGSRR